MFEAFGFGEINPFCDLPTPTTQTGLPYQPGICKKAVRNPQKGRYAKPPAEAPGEER